MTRKRKAGKSRTSPKTRRGASKGSSLRDLWIALGIVAAVALALGLLYHFTVSHPPTAKRQVLSWDEPPPMQIDTTKSYEAVLTTAKGEIRIELYDDLAPITVNNFVFLARQGYYRDVAFHRVIPGFVAQAGDPTGKGDGGPGYTLPTEFTPELRHDAAGVVSMANVGTESHGSQFFITYTATPHLDDRCTIFGRVIAGMDVVESLTPRDPDTATEPGDKIESVTIIER